MIELLLAEIAEFGELLFVEDGLQFFLGLIVEGVEFFAEILAGGFLFAVFATDFPGLFGGIGEDGAECGFLFGSEFQFLFEVRHAAVENASGDSLTAGGLRLGRGRKGEGSEGQGGDTDDLLCCFHFRLEPPILETRCGGNSFGAWRRF